MKSQIFFILIIIFSSSVILLNNNAFGDIPNPNYNKIISNFTIPDYANQVRFNPLNNQTFVTTFGNNINNLTGSNQIGFINVLGSQTDLVLNTNNSKIYMTKGAPSNSVIILNNLNNLVNTIGFFNNPNGITYSPITNEVYVTGQSPERIDIINSTDQISGNIPLPSATLVFLAFNPINSEVYATNGTSVIVINSTDQILTTIDLPIQSIRYIAYSPINNQIYVTGFNYTGSSVFAIDPSNNINGSIITNTAVDGITFNTKTGNTYFTNEDNSTVSVANINNQIIDTITGFTPPFDAELSISYNPSNGFIYVSSNDNGNVLVIDGNPTIPSPPTPTPTSLNKISIIEYSVYAFFAYSSLFLLILSVVKDIPSTNNLVMFRLVYIIPGIICAGIIATSGVIDISFNTLQTSTITKDLNTTDTWSETSTVLSNITLQNPVWFTFHYLVFIILIIYEFMQIMILFGIDMRLKR